MLAGVRIEEPSDPTAPSTNTGGSVGLACPGGPNPLYSSHIQIDGQIIASGLTINPGDFISVSASVGPSGATVTVTDGHQSQTASGPGASVIGEDIGTIAVNCDVSGSPCQPVPQLTRTVFLGARIDGVDAAAAGATRLDLIDNSGHVEMMSSALRGANQGRFIVWWEGSCGFGPGLC